MRSKITPKFRKLYLALPKEIKKAARESYQRWKVNPTHNSLEFKKIEIGENMSLWSVRINRGYRALGGFVEDDLIVWGWIGPHGEYDKLIEAKRARKGNIAT